jgi:hypothetical protein
MDEYSQTNGATYKKWINMSWPSLHSKSRILDMEFTVAWNSGSPEFQGKSEIHPVNITFAFTNEGYRRQGEWSRTGSF